MVRTSRFPPLEGTLDLFGQPLFTFNSLTGDQTYVWLNLVLDGPALIQPPPDEVVEVHRRFTARGGFMGFEGEPTLDHLFYDFQVYGAGTATLTYTSKFDELTFISAVYDFTAVPEPATAGSMLLGIVLVAGFGHGRGKAIKLRFARLFS